MLEKSSEKGVDVKTSTNSKEAQVKNADKNIVFRDGKLVYLSPLDVSDAPILAEHINDKETTKGITAIHPATISDEESFIENANKDMSKSITFAVRESGTDELVGTVGIGRIHHVNRTAETGFAFRRKFWRKGYGTEAVTLLLQYSFNTLNLRTIASSVYDFNKGSIRIHEKLGYKHIGTRENWHYKDGQYISELLYTLTKEDFFKAIG